MVQTRSGEQTIGHEPSSTRQTKVKKDDAQAKEDIEGDSATVEKRKRDEPENQPQAIKEPDAEPPANKAVKADAAVTNGHNKPKSMGVVEQPVATKVHKAIVDYGSLPLQGTTVKGPLNPHPETLLAMILDAMLKSTRISHELAQKTINTVIQAGYHDIEMLRQSTWDDRVRVLSEGGYNRYREQTATRLGDLADLIDTKYDRDLNNLLKKAGSKPDRVRKLTKEIKGLGDLGVDLFFNNAQAVWPCLAPFIDTRSLDTAEKVGIGRDLGGIYAELNQDPVEMSKLALGLSAVRLAKRQDDLEAEE